MRRISGFALAMLVAVGMLACLSPAASAPSVSTVQCVVSRTSTTIGACIGSAAALSAMGVVISLFFVGIIYLLGEVLSFERLKGFWKAEMWETIKSAIIVMIIFSSLVIGGDVAVALAGSTPTAGNTSAALSGNLGNLYNVAYNSYLYPQLQNSYATWAGVLGLAQGLDLITSLQLDTWFPVPIIPEFTVASANFGSSANLLVTTFSSTTSGLLAETMRLVNPLVIAFQMQYDLFTIIVSAGLGMFIPAGVILRSVPLVRKVGSSLIAFGIGLALVYPALLVGFNLPITNYMYSITSTVGQPACPFSGHILCTLYEGMVAFIKGAAELAPGLVFGTAPVAFAFGPSASLSTSVIAEAGSGFWIGLGGAFINGVFPMLNFITDNMLMLLVQSLLFIIDVIIGFAITEGIAGLLGGSVSGYLRPHRRFSLT